MTLSFVMRRHMTIFPGGGSEALFRSPLSRGIFIMSSETVAFRFLASGFVLTNSSRRALNVLQNIEFPSPSACSGPQTRAIPTHDFYPRMPPIAEDKQSACTRVFAQALRHQRVQAIETLALIPISE